MPVNMQKHSLTGWLQKPRSGGIFLPGNNPKHTARITQVSKKKKKKKGRNINRARSKHKLLGLALPHSNPCFLFIYFWTVCDIMKPLSPPEYVWMFVPHLVLLVWCFYYCYLLLQEPGYMGAQLMLANKPYGSSSCPKNLLISVNSA